MNPECESLFGQSKNKIVNMDLEALSISHKLKKTIKNVLVSSNNVKNLIMSHVDPGGQKLYLNVSSSKIVDETRKVLGYLFIIQNITIEQKRSEFLERMNKLISLGELATNIAHEIRNPITGIGVVLDILKSNEKLSRSEEGLINEANEEIGRVEKLLSDLLDFAKPKEFNFELADINDVINGISFIINQLKSRHVKLVFKLDQGMPMILLDQKRIRQALINMAINSLQAMPRSGELKFVTEYSVDPGNDQVKIYVIDTGIGISNEHKNRIFDPFFTTRNDGVGLGLSITHSIIKEHGGMIEVDSEVGKGTKFAIILPCRQNIQSMHPTN